MVLNDQYELKIFPFQPPKTALLERKNIKILRRNQSNFYCAYQHAGHCTWWSSKCTKIFAVFNENAYTPLQIIFLTNLTGIIIIIDPQSSRTLQKMMSDFLKKNLLILKLSLLAQNQWFCTVVWMLCENNMLE